MVRLGLRIMCTASSPTSSAVPLHKHPFNQSCSVGKGRLFAVWRGEWVTSSGAVHNVAVKLPRTHNTSNIFGDQIRKALHDVVKIHMKLKKTHPNIVRCFGARSGRFSWWPHDPIVVGKERTFGVFEYVPSSLEKLLYEDDDFRTSCTYRKLLGIFIDIASGLKCLHENHLAHYNLKPSNVLIDDNGTAKLTNFRALSLLRAIESSKEAGESVDYTAPDLLVDGNLKNKGTADIYSLGMIMTECLWRGSATKTGPSELLELVFICCNDKVMKKKESRKRPTATKVKKSLTAMLEATWIDNLLPWANKACTSTELLDGLSPYNCLIMNRRKCIGRVYEGFFKGVYKDNTETVHEVAIKLTEESDQDDARIHLKKELKVFDSLAADCSNVVKCFGGNIGDSEWDMAGIDEIQLEGEVDFLVLEFLPANLNELLYENEEFARICTYKRMVNIFLDIARGLSHMHEHHVVHYDLKPSKILIDQYGTAKIAGLRLSEIKSGRVLHRGLTGTFKYMAPELIYPIELNGARVEPTESIDIFSLGRLMAECLTRTNPLKNKRKRGHEALWALIEECCPADVEVDDANCIVRPTAVSLATQLEGLLNEDWIEDLIPWVKEVQIREYLAEQAHDNCYNICRCVERLEMDNYGSLFRGLCVDANGKIHEVAVKVPNDSMEDTDLEAIQAELHVHKKLECDQHASVVECYGGSLGLTHWDMSRLQKLEMEGEEYFAVLHLMPTNLHRLLYEDPVFAATCTYRKVITMFIELAEGLHHLHQNCIVHFDLKPSNVGSTAEGRVKLSGFHASTIRQNRPIPWRLAGTLGYIAPELFYPRCNGQDLRITDSIDVFSLGALMVECLTRQHPHEMQEARSCLELWDAIDGCCADRIRTDGNDRILIATTDEGVKSELLETVSEEWVGCYPPWPAEFWALVEQNEDSLSGDKSHSNAEEVLRCLEGIVDGNRQGGGPPWPPQLCLLVAQCLSFVVEDGQDYVTRPTASQIATHLRLLLQERWIDEFLPWVAEKSNCSALCDELDPGSCWPSDRERCLGVGAFGSVWKGLYKDAQGNVHNVAIKLTNRLRPGQLDKTREALQNELQLFDTLPDGHPNIVHCFGGNTPLEPWDLDRMERIKMADHAHFLVLELLPRNLHQLLYEDQEFARTCTYKRAIGLFIDIARGLSFLQDNKVVHQDLKPSNVLIDKDGKAKITDFGSSKVRVKFSFTCSCRGTIGYMAPEILWPLRRGKSARITDSVDSFSLGVIMAECLAHQDPIDLEFGDEPAELWELICECCAHCVVDDANHVLRPSAAEIVTRLEAMLDRQWVSHLLPWEGSMICSSQC